MNISENVIQTVRERGQHREFQATNFSFSKRLTEERAKERYKSQIDKLCGYEYSRMVIRSPQILFHVVY